MVNCKEKPGVSLRCPSCTAKIKHVLSSPYLLTRQVMATSWLCEGQHVLIQKYWFSCDVDMVIAAWTI